MTYSYYSMSRLVGLFLGPLIFLTIMLVPHPTHLNINAWHYVACTLFILTWLIFEPIPIGMTSMLPLILYPITGVMDVSDVLKNFASPYIFLFIGGYLIAICMEKHNVHKVISYKIISRIGKKPSRIVLALMLSTYFFSMWMTNTAATIMMLPLAMALIRSLDKFEADTDKSNFIISLLLCIPYAATIGGMSTLVGSPPNLILASFMKGTFGVDVHFQGWLYFGIPLSISLLLIAYIVITKICFPSKIKIEYTSDFINLILTDVKLKKSQIKILLIFAITCCLWITRPFINTHFPNFELTDEMIAIFASILLFITPMKFRDGHFLLMKEDLGHVQWSTLMLFGCGMVISFGLNKTGILDLISKYFSVYKDFSQLGFIIISVIILSIVTEFINNTSLTLTIIPLTSAVTLALGFNPLIVGLLSVFAISLSFVLPVSTPPNTLAYIDNYIKTEDFIRAGTLIKIAGIIILLIMYYFNFFDVYKVDFELIQSFDKT